MLSFYYVDVLSGTFVQGYKDDPSWTTFYILQSCKQVSLISTQFSLFSLVTHEVKLLWILSGSIFYINV